MAVAFLLDENIPGRVCRAILRHNHLMPEKLDVVSVGGPGDLPFGLDDPSILRWAEREERILITEDKRTMPAHLRDHLQQGHHSPGVFLVRRGVRVLELVELLTLVAVASEPAEWKDRITYVP